MVDANETPQSQANARPAPRDRLVGQTLEGRYQIEDVLGSGGMSVVYKATQLRVNRTVAIKTLRMQVDDRPVYRERFEREISSLCALSHPNIVTVYDCLIGENEQPYVVMDYLRGKSLEALIEAEGPLNIERFSRIVVQICSALDHAHKKGIVHRDLKPGNVVLMDDETDFVKVVDFGLARLGQDGRKLTNTGELWGSPPYMSPEQCKGEPVDERSDLYSMGAVMYEMLTGRDPFNDSSTIFELIQKHVNVTPPTLAEGNPYVKFPEQLEAVIQKAMAKAPADRYQNANELQEAVIAACSGEIAKESRDQLYHLATRTRPTSQQPVIDLANDKTVSTGSAREAFSRALDPTQGAIDAETGSVDLDKLFDERARRSHTTQPNIARTPQPQSKWARDAAYEPGAAPPATPAEPPGANGGQAAIPGTGAGAAATGAAGAAPGAIPQPGLAGELDQIRPDIRGQVPQADPRKVTGAAFGAGAGAGPGATAAGASMREIQNNRSRYSASAGSPSTGKIVAAALIGAAATAAIIITAYIKLIPHPQLDRYRPPAAAQVESGETTSPTTATGSATAATQTPAVSHTTTAATPVSSAALSTSHTNSSAGEHAQKPKKQHHQEKPPAPKKRHTPAASTQASTSSSSSSGHSHSGSANPWSLLDKMRKPGK